MLSKIWRWFQKYRIALVLTILLAGSAVIHSHNMFGFPYYENDEGVYMSQAWSLLKFGQLAPYTYWYDHAPAGWILIAIWTKLTGGFFTFGPSVNSGRFLMMVLHTISAGLILFIGKKLTSRWFPGVIAVLFFSLSPLALYFQRRVLLDNIMIFWILLALAILLKDKLKLSQIVVSAICFGIGVLTKENAIFFLPAFVYAVYLKSHAQHRSFAMVKWVAVSGFVVSVYFLYALLKQELFPADPQSGIEKVSLLSTLMMQYGRGSGLPFWSPESDFATFWQDWVQRDGFTLALGLLATVIITLLSFRNKMLRIPTFLLFFFWLFLIRGKTVIDFYIVPLIPILALSIGIVIDADVELIHQLKIKLAPLVLRALVVVIISLVLASGLKDHLTKDETAPQLTAVDWIRNNLQPDDRIVIDDYGYVDLHDAPSSDIKTFPHADWFWKLELDSDIRNDKYDNDWRNIDYIVLSHEMLKQTKIEGTQPFLNQALDYSDQLRLWQSQAGSYLDLRNNLSTNGDWMAVYKVRNQSEIDLDSAWQFYQDHFIHSYGQVIDPQTGLTTSEGQSYAMLRAVWQGDRETFDGVWAWTRDHLQFRQGDVLLSWLWHGDETGGTIQDSASATDADEDIALALILAYRRWGEHEYLNQAQRLLDDIWQHEVVAINNRLYLTAGSNAEQATVYIINPSYLSPASYRVFAEVDPDHDWLGLATDSYALLRDIQVLNLSVLPPNWVVIGKDGQLGQADGIVSNENATDYGYDAFRIFWRVALDAEWFNTPAAVAYLNEAAEFFKPRLEERKLAAVYDLSGQAQVPYESLSTWTAPLAVLAITDPGLAESLYQVKMQPVFKAAEGYWGNKSNYYDQNWIWFGLALQAHKLPRP